LIIDLNAKLPPLGDQSIILWCLINFYIIELHSIGILTLCNSWLSAMCRQAWL